jgi:hypothetical protein
VGTRSFEEPFRILESRSPRISQARMGEVGSGKAGRIVITREGDYLSKSQIQPIFSSLSMCLSFHFPTHAITTNLQPSISKAAPKLVFQTTIPRTPQYAFIAECFRSKRSSADHPVVPIGSMSRRSRPSLVRNRKVRRLGSLQ